MTAWILLAGIAVQGFIIGSLLAQIKQLRKDRDDALKWAAKREILRKFYKDNQ